MPQPDHTVIFNGTTDTLWGRYLEEGNRKNAQTFQSRPAPQIVRQDDRGRPAHALDILAVLNVAKTPITKTEIMKRTSASLERVSQELDKLIAAGQVQRTVAHHRGNMAVYSAVR